MQHNSELPDRFWIVVSQWDSQYADKKGPLVHESYCYTESEADRYIDGLGDRYGWIKKLYVVVADTPLIVGV